MTKKYEKEAVWCSNEIIIENIEYWINRNNNTKIAIYSSISKPYWRVDENYIKEKLSAVKDVDKWLMYYIKEADKRIQKWELSMVQMQRYQDAIQSTRNLFKDIWN